MRSLSSLAMALAAGCTGTSSIGSSPDAKLDAILIDGDLHGATTVTVQSLRGDGEPEAGATVIASDGDGAHIATTDASGAASVTILPGATVSVVRRFAGGSRIATVLGVDPGDALHFGKRPPASQPVAGEMTFSFTEAFGATTHTLYNGCDKADGRSTGVALAFTPACGAGARDILLVARDNLGVVLAWDSLLDVALTATPTPRPIPAPLQTPVRFTATYSEVPAEAEFLAMTRTCYSDGLPYAELGAQARQSGLVMVATLNHPSFGDRMGVTTLVGQRADSGGPIQTLVERRAIAATFELAVGSALLPWVSEVRYDAALRTLSWTLAGENQADAVLVQVTHRTSEPAGAHEWWIIAPPTTSTLTLPELPAEVADLAPTAATGFSAKVKLVEVGHRSGYAEFRTAGEPDGADVETLHEVDRVRISTTDLLTVSP